MLDTSMLAFLAAPFVASLILTGIHAYLGVHVVERGDPGVSALVSGEPDLDGVPENLLPLFRRCFAKVVSFGGRFRSLPSSVSRSRNRLMSLPWISRKWRLANARLPTEMVRR